MWAQLSELAKKWKHRIQIFMQWSETTNAINARVLRLLYGPGHGTDSIIFRRSNGELIDINLDDRYIFTAWYRMLHLLGMFEGSVANADNYFEAIKGIGKLARSYIRLVPTNILKGTMQGGIVPPSGDTILHICGGWLFEAINHYQKGFDRGKEEALMTLCSLFASRPAHQFHPNYLAHFYRGIEKALGTQNTNLLGVILRDSTSFFQNNFQGAHVLIPAYVITMGRILFSSVSENLVPFHN
jgi:hypothetical protein